MQKLPYCSIIILNRNGKHHLNDCFSSLRKLNYPKKRYEAIMVDNASSDGSIEYVKKNFKEVKIVANKVGLGFAAGNNEGVKRARGEYIILLNNDTKVQKNWLIELVKVAQSDKTIGLCTSKLLLFSKRDTVNYAGGFIHYLGFSWPIGLFEKDGKKFDELKETTQASGGSLLIKRNLIKRIGMLDGDFFLYVEDTDYSWRARLNGFKIFYVPKSMVYHKYGATISRENKGEKIYFLERNRIVMLLKDYSLKTLLVLVPMLILFELALIVFLPMPKLRGYVSIFRNFERILKKRIEVQKLRKISDKQITDAFVSDFKDFEYFDKSYIIEKILNPILRIYWKIAKKLI